MDPESGKAKKLATSCAECKRLKMKCDRNVPCSSCTKRGLSNLCLSNGTLRPGKGTRYILASTEELHAKIDQLLERARDLEVALDASYSLHSTTTHGLLRKDLLVEGSRLALEKEHEEEPEVPVAALGTLKISQKTGGAAWIGSTASSYFFVHDDDNASVTSSVDTLPEHDHMLREMCGSLPSKEEAWSLLESYHENFTWNYNPIPRTVLIREFLSPTYDPRQGPPSLLHLSVLFSMFSIGILVDLSRAPNSAEAKMYRDVAKIPLDIESVSKDTSIVTLEALIMYAQAIQWSDDPNGPANTWTYLSLSVTLGESIGLHRDPKSTWDMDDAMTLRRRRVFWELIYMVTWQCLIHGRPPLLTQRHIDVQLPHEETEESMGTDPAFHLWRYRWTKEIGWVIADQLLAPAYPPTHALVMKIDKKIREFGFPWDVDVKPEDPDDIGVLQDFENMMMNGILELTSLHVHRGFFAHALFQCPTDPLTSKFAASVYAAFGAACRIIQRSRDYHSRRPLIMKRSNIMYSHTFSAAVIVGAIATQAPQCSLATAALHELDTACAIFKFGQNNMRVQKILYIMTRLQSKARDIYQSRGSMVRAPEAPVDLPGIIGGPSVVKSGSRSPEGSTRHSNSPESSSPATYEPQNPTILSSPPEVQAANEPLTPQNSSRPLPDEYAYTQQPFDTGYQAGPPVDWTSSQYFVPQAPPEMYMQPSRIGAPQSHDPYVWQQANPMPVPEIHQRNVRSSTIIAPVRTPQYHDIHPPPPPAHRVPQHSHHQSREVYHNVPQYQYPLHTNQHPHSHTQTMADNQNLVVAPDQSWSIFLGRMGVQ